MDAISPEGRVLVKTHSSRQFAKFLFTLLNEHGGKKRRLQASVDEQDAIRRTSQLATAFLIEKPPDEASEFEALLRFVDPRVACHPEQTHSLLQLMEALVESKIGAEEKHQLMKKISRLIDHYCSFRVSTEMQLCQSSSRVIFPVPFDSQQMFMFFWLGLRWYVKVDPLQLDLAFELTSKTSHDWNVVVEVKIDLSFVNPFGKEMRTICVEQPLLEFSSSTSNKRSASLHFSKDEDGGEHALKLRLDLVKFQQSYTSSSKRE